MISAKSIVTSLYQNFELIEVLVRECQKSGFLTKREMQNLAMLVNNQSSEKSHRALNDLTRKGILKSIDQDQTFKVQHSIMEFVLSLVHEQELGLVGIIDVERKEIDEIGKAIQVALESSDFSVIKDKTISLSNQIGNISDQLISDRDAIKTIIEEAKKFPPNTPLKVRYKKVFECFDHYIDPMISLLDNNVSGFQDMLYQIEDVLKEAVRKHSIQKGLATLPSAINGTICQMHKLIDQLNLNLELYQKDLAPLRNELSSNDEISRSVNALFSRIRKKGIKQTVGKNIIKIGGTSRSVKISFCGDNRDYAANILDYKPSKVQFRASTDSEFDVTMPIPIEDVLKDLENVHDSVSIMEWLRDKYPNQKEKSILSLYHQLVRLIGDKLVQKDLKETTSLKEHNIIFYPHYLEKVQ